MRAQREGTAGFTLGSWVGSGRQGVRVHRARMHACTARTYIQCDRAIPISLRPPLRGSQGRALGGGLVYVKVELSVAAATAAALYMQWREGNRHNLPRSDLRLDRPIRWLAEMGSAFSARSDLRSNAHNPSPEPNPNPDPDPSPSKAHTHSFA